MAENNKVCTGCGEHQEESLAMELLREKKKDAKWWRIFALIELAVIVGAICIVAYLFATTEVTYTELNPDGGGHANYISDSTVGDVNNGEHKGANNSSEE